MAKFRDGMAGPTVILLVICAVIAFALAGTYQATAPIIAEGEIAAANEARALVLPTASTFHEVTGAALPEGIPEVYKADNNTGFVFKSQSRGFGGTVTFYVGVDAKGNFVGINMFDHEETPGLGTKVGNAEYLARYYGSSNVDGVDTITGATITSTALKNALRQVQAAYELVKEAA